MVSYPSGEALPSILRNEIGPQIPLGPSTHFSRSPLNYRAGKRRCLPAKGSIMETSLASLWLPIILSAVALFFASFLAWTKLPHHKKDWIGLPNEDAIMHQIKDDNLPAGQYCFPFAATSEAMSSEAFKSKMAAGPCGTLTLWKAPPNMGVNMACTVAFFAIASAVIAYLAGMVIKPGADCWFVFRFVGTAGVLTYGTANILNGIWFGRKMVGDIADGVAYGLITGAIFAFLWPGVTA